MTAVVDSPRLWETRALCGLDPDLWHARVGSVNWGGVGEARHICLHHCPVQAECAQNIPPMRSAVVAGVFYNQHLRQADYQPIADRCRICRPGRRPS